MTNKQNKGKDISRKYAKCAEFFIIFAPFAPLREIKLSIAEVLEIWERWRCSIYGEYFDSTM